MMGMMGVADTTFVASATGPGNLTPGSGCGTMCTTHPIKASLLETLPLVVCCGSTCSRKGIRPRTRHRPAVHRGYLEQKQCSVLEFMSSFVTGTFR